ncbi:hypothetical protein PR048_002659 [Dryococelus australis]|uniref:Uncharacterized protein n=1 Tax=Dryococelus australis TaxID=614101 RepID=A0ABQ9IKT4_9NEOP|nr:hypothetical protein PR048_002659 [Dryococelus australis]
MSDAVKAVEAATPVASKPDAPAQSAEKVPAQSDEGKASSVARIAKLPVVEQSLNTASAIYGKVKDSSSIVGWTLDKAESAVSKAVEVATPVTTHLERPLHTVDSILSKSLDYVEKKVPAVKMTPDGVYTVTKEYIVETVHPVVVCSGVVKEYATAAIVNTAKLIPGMTHTQPMVQDAEKKGT